MMVSIAIVMFWGIGVVLTFYILHWLVIEMPVYQRIKHEELYEKQKYPHTNGNKYEIK